MEDIMEDNFEKLNLLLEQELCELVDIPDGFTGQTAMWSIYRQLKENRQILS